MKRYRIFLLCAAFIAFAFAPQIQASTNADNMTELREGWRMAPAEVSDEGSVVSRPAFDVSKWYRVGAMPSTVLQILEGNGVYKDLYYGMNLATAVPQDLWKKDWWYRTMFTAPSGQEVYSLIFKGINYRADIWLNGHQLADRSQVVGMYNSFEFDVSKLVKTDAENVLAVRVIPERALPDVNGVELADSWLDWINWKYLGYHEPGKQLELSFVPDRNAGVWKRVYLSSSGKVVVRNPYVSTDLPLPATSPAALTVYCDVRNATSTEVSGTLLGEVSRPGKSTIKFSKAVTLSGSETREIAVSAADYSQLSIKDPDLWWPYQWGKPDLYQLKLEFQIGGQGSDRKAINFGIREITQHRDSDNSFPTIGKGGNFYLQVNGKDFLIRGAAYAPDLLFKHDPERDRTNMKYAKDLGLNLLRWELKIADDDMLELADREGVPVMFGWMCCAQWEKWSQWSSEDHRVAHESMEAQIRHLRSHAAVFIWANGSDGLPPDPVLNDYHQVLHDMHWQNAVVDTLSHVNRDWSGIHMAGPYVWRPPYYWFSDKYGPARGSSAEEGDNEVIPPFESLKKFIPADKLWPINEYWYFHAGANEGNNTLSSIKKAIDERYGPSTSAEEFSKKAQLAHYENARAQFETYAASGWSNHKMMVYWMLDNHWPSFFGHLYDYYFKQGGGYFGAKKALQPVNVVYDYYATGDRSAAKIYVANQTLNEQTGLEVSVKFYNLDGQQKYSNEAKNVRVGSSTSVKVMTVGRIAGLTPAYFVRCQLKDGRGTLLEDNVYWQSVQNDDIGEPRNDQQFSLTQTKWADYSALNTMAPAQVSASATYAVTGNEGTARITIRNTSTHVAFFIRAEITQGNNGPELLPITYNDNYITLFPNEARTIDATFQTSDLSGKSPAVRLEGYNVPRQDHPVSSR